MVGAVLDLQAINAMTSLDWRKTMQLLLPAALLLTIPGFYLVLDGATPSYRIAGQLLYGLAVALCAAHLSMPAPDHERHPVRHWRRIDGLLLVAITASIWPSAPPWSDTEWLLRLLTTV